MLNEIVFSGDFMGSAKPRLNLISSMVIFGTIGAFVRLIPLSSGGIAFCRACLAVMLIGAFLLIKREKIPVKSIKKELPLLLLSGAAMGVNWILLFEAYKYTTVSLATLSYYFAPVIVTVACPILFREKLTAKQIICFIMSTLGIVMITGTGSKGGTDLIGIFFGIGAAVLYATVVLINKFIKNVDGIHRTFLQFVSAAAVLLPYALITRSLDFSKFDLKSTVMLLIVGFVHTGIAYCLYFPSLRGVSGQEAALLSYVDPLVAVLVSVTFLREGMTLLQVIGGALILGFAFINEIKFKKKQGDNSK